MYVRSYFEGKIQEASVPRGDSQALPSNQCRSVPPMSMTPGTGPDNTSFFFLSLASHTLACCGKSVW
ncbi:hypothetical protein E2C01_037262 [Portunus trituberculatus]|uniref:Uncharacterized protein n=1 Tax=Portunus trituberculatus TaxID=210409 RepID=A0A5B7FAY0_PORTR|nr:hypothetical protein [Portunus trituberculatus]